MAKKAPRRKTAGKVRGPAKPPKKKATKKKAQTRPIPVDIREGEEWKERVIEAIEIHVVNFADVVNTTGVSTKADALMKVGCVFGAASLGAVFLGITDDAEGDRFGQYVMEIFLQALDKDADPRLLELTRAFTEPDEEVRTEILAEAGYGVRETKDEG